MLLLFQLYHICLPFSPQDNSGRRAFIVITIDREVKKPWLREDKARLLTQLLAFRAHVLSATLCHFSSFSAQP